MWMCATPTAPFANNKKGTNARFESASTLTHSLRDGLARTHLPEGGERLPQQARPVSPPLPRRLPRKPPQLLHSQDERVPPPLHRSHVYPTPQAPPPPGGLKPRPARSPCRAHANDSASFPAASVADKQQLPRPPELPRVRLQQRAKPSRQPHPPAVGSRNRIQVVRRHTSSRHPASFHRALQIASSRETAPTAIE